MNFCIQGGTFDCLILFSCTCLIRLASSFICSLCEALRGVPHRIKANLFSNCANCLTLQAFIVFECLCWTDCYLLYFWMNLSVLFCMEYAYICQSCCIFVRVVVLRLSSIMSNLTLLTPSSSPSVFTHYLSELILSTPRTVGPFRKHKPRLSHFFALVLTLHLQYAVKPPK